MASEARTIHKTDFEVGQWIQFATDKNLSEAPQEQQAIYQKDQRFLVFSREDRVFSPCRCFVVDINGDRFDYSADIFAIGNRFDKWAELVWDSKVRVVSRESVETLHGSEKIQAVYESAQKHIDDLKDYFAKFRAQVLSASTSMQHNLDNLPKS